MEPQNKSYKNVGITLGIIVIVGVIFVTVLADKKTQPDTTVSNQTSSDTTTATVQTTPTPIETPVVSKPTPVVTPVKTPVATFVYKDGTYSATGSYMSPGGEDQLKVTLTLNNDVVTSASVTPEAGDRTSARYQNMFISGYTPYVVGKNVASISLSKISGSSLTPRGFNDALAQIKTQAKA